MCMESLSVHLNPTALFQNAVNTCMVFEIFILCVRRTEMELHTLHVGKESAATWLNLEFLTSHIDSVSGTGESKSSNT